LIFQEHIMAGEKIPVTFDINPDAQDMLKRITEKYKLPDESKALRCLLDYAATDGDWGEIFAKMRCRRCG
jgi:hypothetical protein